MSQELEAHHIREALRCELPALLSNCQHTSLCHHVYMSPASAWPAVCALRDCSLPFPPCLQLEHAQESSSKDRRQARPAQHHPRLPDSLRPASRLCDSTQACVYPHTHAGAEGSALLAGILHTIFFHRALGAVKPLEKDCELFDVTYAQCNDAAADQRIAAVASQFEAWALSHPGKRGQVCIFWSIGTCCLCSAC